MLLNVIIDSAVNEGTLRNDGIELDPENLPCAYVDKSMRIRICFTNDSWSRVLKAVELNKKMKYYCQVCEQDLDQEEKGLLCIYLLQWMFTLAAFVLC